MSQMSFERKSGIILHPTSLPGPDGIGDLGPEVYRWIDFLDSSGTQLWQILPLGPTGYGDSPYQCFSAFAGNPLLVSPLVLFEEGLLRIQDLKERPDFPADEVDFGAVIGWKTLLLNKAFLAFRDKPQPALEKEFDAFVETQKNWLNDFALFMAIKESQDLHSWIEWSEPLKTRQPGAISEAQTQLADTIQKHKFNQFLFFRQWARAKAYANQKGIQIIGDMPFVISLDSSDVWANPGLFLLDEELNPTFVAGVPPDYFSETGQLWGNPLYDWKFHLETNFEWWVARLRSILELVDMVRLDHFRGFAAAWHVPYGNETAIEGEWIPGPAVELFTELKRNFPSLPIIAEDLGVITPDVKSLRDGFDLPGMKILQFAFSGDPEDDFLPHHYPVNCFAYTGSHDNNTARGWYDDATEFEQQFCRDYLNFDSEDEAAWAMIRSVWQSVANYALAPIQDFLGLGSKARFNLPGKMDGNWKWRMTSQDISVELAKRIRKMNLLYSRLSPAEKTKYTNWVAAHRGDQVSPH
jgi:4-alpha-glucanotransferase